MIGKMPSTKADQLAYVSKKTVMYMGIAYIHMYGGINWNTKMDPWQFDGAFYQNPVIRTHHIDEKPVNV